jgi:hypothetical protein
VSTITASPHPRKHIHTRRKQTQVKRSLATNKHRQGQRQPNVNPPPPPHTHTRQFTATGRTHTRRLPTSHRSQSQSPILLARVLQPVGETTTTTHTHTHAHTHIPVMSGPLCTSTMRSWPRRVFAQYLGTTATTSEGNREATILERRISPPSPPPFRRPSPRPPSRLSCHQAPANTTSLIHSCHSFI